MAGESFSYEKPVIKGYYISKRLCILVILALVLAFIGVVVGLVLGLKVLSPKCVPPYTDEKIIDECKLLTCKNPTLLQGIIKAL